MDGTDGSIGSRRPVMTVQVGATGHRALSDNAGDALAATATQLLRAIADAALRLHATDQASADPVFADDAPMLRLVCGLASGADTVLAEAARASGWSLVATLPFARNDFEQDFAAADLPRFRALLSQAVIVSELNGDHGRGGEPYAEIGRQIVEQSDILLAVWDGLPPRGPGGTGEVVQLALDRRVPVAVLSPDGLGAPVWHTATDNAVIDAIVATAVLPPADQSGFPQALYHEPLVFSTWAATAVRTFERAMLLGAPRPAPAVLGTPAPPMPVTGPEQQVDAMFTIADRVAGRYAARFRAAGLLRYSLVLPATLGAFIASFGPGWAKPVGYVIQFGSLGAVLLFSVRGSWARDQGRFIAYRAVAEYIRNARLLLPLGAMVTPPIIPVHQERVADWASWYGRAVLRQAGLPGRYVDPAAVAMARQGVRTAVEAEIAFLRSRVARFGVIARRLRLIGLGLTISGFVLAAIHGAMDFAHAGVRTTAWLSELALVVPALAPIAMGLLGFGEYGRLSTRYSAVVAELEAAVAALDRVGPDRRAVLPIARRITEVMLAEGADWQLMIKARTMATF